MDPSPLWHGKRSTKMTLVDGKRSAKMTLVAARSPTESLLLPPAPWPPQRPSPASYSDTPNRCSCGAAVRMGKIELEEAEVKADTDHKGCHSLVDVHYFHFEFLHYFW